MSARFGRNKRRKMREQIECQANIIQSDLNYMVSQKYRIDNLLNEVASHEQFVINIGSLVGRFSIIAGKPKTMRIDGDMRSQLNYIPTQDYCFNNDIMPVSKLRYDIMQVLNVKANRDKFKGMIQAHVHFGDKTVGYGLSDEVLYNLGPDDLAKMIAPEIAEMLAKEFAKIK